MAHDPRTVFQDSDEHSSGCDKPESLIRSPYLKYLSAGSSTFSAGIFTFEESAGVAPIWPRHCLRRLRAFMPMSSPFITRARIVAAISISERWLRSDQGSSSRNVFHAPNWLCVLNHFGASPNGPCDDGSLRSLNRFGFRVVQPVT